MHLLMKYVYIYCALAVFCIVVNSVHPW